MAAMKLAKLHLVSINGGSSSIKFALYKVEEALQQ
jgi:acetate kinase